MNRAWPNETRRPDAESTIESKLAAGVIGPVGLELRQISGLTAGGAFPITASGIIVADDQGRSAFRLDADADDGLVLSPLDGPVRLDGRLVDAPAHVGNSVIDIGSATFVIRARRSIKRYPPGTRAPQDRSIDRLPGPVHLISTPDPLPVGGLPELLKLEHASTLRRVRAMWPDPEEIMFHAFDGGPGLWSQWAGDPAFGHVVVAHGTVPWQPRLDTDDRQVSTDVQTLPGVPIVADLGAGPIGIVGERQMTLAVARQIVLHRAVLSPPTDLAVGVTSNAETVGDWAWIEPLPHLADQEVVRTPLRVIDDPLQFHQEGDVFITDNVGLLPIERSMTMLVHDDHRCTVIDHRTQIVVADATPLGLQLHLASGAIASMVAAHPVFEAIQRRERNERRRRSQECANDVPPIGGTPLIHGYESAFF